MSTESEDRWRLRALEAEDNLRDLEKGVAEIVYALTQKQPAPRSASVTYVAGYARAMDDMKQIILEVARRHQAAVKARRQPHDVVLETDSVHMVMELAHEVAHGPVCTACWFGEHERCVSDECTCRHEESSE